MDDLQSKISHHLETQLPRLKMYALRNTFVIPEHVVLPDEQVYTHQAQTTNITQHQNHKHQQQNQPVKASQSQHYNNTSTTCAIAVQCTYDVQASVRVLRHSHVDPHVDSHVDPFRCGAFFLTIVF